MPDWQRYILRLKRKSNGNTQINRRKTQRFRQGFSLFCSCRTFVLPLEKIKEMKMGQTTTPEKTPVDWGKILTGATTLASSYLTFRASTRPGQPAPTPAPAPTGMSSNTKTLLIGGAVIAAGLLIYSMTKKK